MNCSERQEELLELARAGQPPPSDLAAHLARCEECAASFEDQRALGAALARLASENAAVPMPATVEARIFAELSPRRIWRPLAAAVLAASLAVAVYVARGPVRPPAEAAPFVEIPFVAPLAPYERATIQRMDVPVAALIAAGFEVRLPDASGTVKADVLLGQDGRPHAIRIVQEVNQ